MTVFLLAAALGAVLRYLADFYWPRTGILLANMAGSLIAGGVIMLSLISPLPDVLFQAIFGGFTGSLTTYSTVAILAAEQWQHRRGSPAKTWLTHIGLSVASGLVGVGLVLLLQAIQLLPQR